MTEKQNQQENQTVEHEKGNPPKYKNATGLSRRERRHPFRKKYRNDRTPVGTGFLQMGVAWDGKVIYMPKRKKLKGWQRENLRK